MLSAAAGNPAGCRILTPGLLGQPGVYCLIHRESNSVCLVGGQQITVTDEVLGRFRRDRSVKRHIPVPLLQRETLIAACLALHCRLRERNVTARQIAGIALAEAITA